MPCFPCLSPPLPIAQGDAKKAGAFKIKVRLSTGLEVPLIALRTDTAADIKHKVESVHGRQPDVAIRGQLVRPPLLALVNGEWVPMAEGATMRDVGMQKILKYADITDKLRLMQAFRHIHWAGSNIGHQAF